MRLPLILSHRPSYRTENAHADTHRGRVEGRLLGAQAGKVRGHAFGRGGRGCGRIRRAVHGKRGGGQGT